MSRPQFSRLPGLACTPLALCLGLLATLPPTAFATEPPVSGAQRSTAQRVAQAGVPLSELSPDAPDTYTVRPGDTLWGISTVFLRSPWRWPELWGMNLEQIRNPHLIYPGQTLVLLRQGDRAVLQLGRSVGTAGADGGPPRDAVLKPRVRSEPLPDAAIASVPMHLIGPFLNDAVVFDTDALLQAPRIVATQEGRVLVSRGEKAYARGDLSASPRWQIFREPKPLVDPDTSEVLGFEARHVGSAEVLAPGDESDPRSIRPATLRITGLRMEAGVGDRMAPVTPPEQDAFVPHAPAQPVSGRIIAVYGDGLNAGQNQVVSLNRGTRDGIERGQVLALWRAGSQRVDPTDKDGTVLTLPDERHGSLFVFRVFDRVSYALILQVQDPVGAGDRFTQP